LYAENNNISKTQNKIKIRTFREMSRRLIRAKKMARLALTSCYSWLEF
jgi:hypothetical protein